MPSAAWLDPLTEGLKELGSRRVWTSRLGRPDEITTTGPTHVVALENGAIRKFTITPDEVGLPKARPEDLKGGDPEHNAKELRAALEGLPTAYRDIAVFNAAAALVVAEGSRPFARASSAPGRRSTRRRAGRARAPDRGLERA